MRFEDRLRGFCSGCGAEITMGQPCIDDGADGLTCATCALRDGDGVSQQVDRPADVASLARGLKACPAPVDPDQLARLCVAGLVRRWHQSPVMAETGQTLADHQGRCVQLLLALNPGASPALIRAVAFHDVGEFGAGDLSGPLKRSQPDLAARHAAFEAGARQAICGADPVLFPDEAAWLGLIDRLEALVWVLMTRPWEAERKAGGWANFRVDLIDRAARLGCEPALRVLLMDLDKGVW